MKITEGLVQIQAMRQTVADHTNQISDIESKQRLHTEKIGLLSRDVAAMYRDFGNLENSKMDRIQGGNLITDLKK